MREKHTISFIPAVAPLREPVTKFGGQPIGLPAHLWPTSRSTKNPMRFICQIALRDVGLSSVPLMAWLFITDEDEFVDGTYEADGGENAVVIHAPEVDGVPASPGPTMYEMVSQPGAQRLVAVPREFAVRLAKGVDPEQAFMKDEPEQLSENKIGGTPAFLQGDDTPKGGYDLLLQLDSTSVPFYVNFGDAGVAYVFIARDRMSGKFLWQCG